ncbi:hypothetical protein EYF80_035900 [Liparis tanakae]|uniref:Uncharacterized protein n=1 Tax=Liparis tanakae TaxID=230148 RepID=A0A4Z2GM90_9TELE|nr:hypothetical protein EYF80_035900 [Liparis tanakae]
MDYQCERGLGGTGGRTLLVPGRRAHQRVGLAHTGLPLLWVGITHWNPDSGGGSRERITDSVWPLHDCYCCFTTTTTTNIYIKPIVCLLKTYELFQTEYKLEGALGRAHTFTSQAWALNHEHVALVANWITIDRAMVKRRF